MEDEILQSLLEEARIDEYVTIENVIDNIITLSNGHIYLIYNDVKRKQVLKEEILNNFNEFDISLLSKFTKLPEVVFESLDEDFSKEDIEDLFNKSKKSFDQFLEKIIETYGYAQFLSYYDGETELNLIENLYAYRID